MKAEVVKIIFTGVSALGSWLIIHDLNKKLDEIVPALVVLLSVGDGVLDNFPKESAQVLGNESDVKRSG